MISHGLHIIWVKIMTEQLQIPPHNLDAERTVLGCCLLETLSLLEVIQIIKPGDFFHPPHIHIFNAMLELQQMGLNVDYVTLGDRLMSTGKIVEAGGPDYLVGLTNVVPTVRSANQYATIVRDKSTLRKVLKVGYQILSDVDQVNGKVDDFVDEVSGLFLDIIEPEESKSYAPVSEMADDYLSWYKATYEDKTLPGIQTGLRKLDDILVGLQPGSLNILAARPSQGKTAFALMVSRMIAGENSRVAYFSLEMSKEEIYIRLLSTGAHVNSYFLKKKQLTEATDDYGYTPFDRLVMETERLKNIEMFIDDSSGLSLNELRAKAKSISLQHKLDLVVVDYLQLIHSDGKGRSREQEVSRITRGLKLLARELKVPVIALSQLSRHIERRDARERIPQLSDLRESGAIEQDADTVMFIHRKISDAEREDPELRYEQGEPQDIKFIVAKNRNGRIARIDMVFNPKIGEFYEIDKDCPE